MDTEIEKKLIALKKMLSEDFRFKDYKISNPELFKSQDPTIWIIGFHESIKIQIKHFKREKIKINIRPVENNVELRKKFSKRIKIAYPNIEQKDKNGFIYLPLCNIKKYKGEFENETVDNIEEIKNELFQAINKLT